MKSLLLPVRLPPRTVITGGYMRQKKIGVLITGIMLAGIMLHADFAFAQDNSTSTVAGKMYICYFYYFQSEAQNTELTFSPMAYISVMDGMGYGLYFTVGSYFAGYYLVLNQPMFRAMRSLEAQGVIDTSDILTIMSGFATGFTIQGAGLTWTDFKNPQLFTFFGYQHVTE